jgi:CRP-like cAMP-binding protein
VTPLQLIEAIPIFTTLTGEEKRVLAEATSVRDFRKGEVIVRQGELLSALMMVRAGVIVMRQGEEDFGRLAPGDFFGETGLLAGIGEACTLEALTRVTVYEIDQQAFAPLLLNRPAMAEDLASSLSKRAQQAHPGGAPGPQQERSVHAFLRAIQTIFHH